MSTIPAPPQNPTSMFPGASSPPASQLGCGLHGHRPKRSRRLAPPPRLLASPSACGRWPSGSPSSLPGWCPCGTRFLALGSGTLSLPWVKSLSDADHPPWGGSGRGLLRGQGEESPMRPRGGGRGRPGHPGGLPGGGGRQWARASCRSWWSTTSATRSRRASSSWTPRSSTPTSLGNARPPRPPAGPQVMPMPTWPTVLSWRCAPLPAFHPQALTAHPPLRKAFRGPL